MGKDRRADRVLVRNIDWREVIRILDELPPDTDVLVGEMDASIRSHIKNGRFKYIDPSRYNVWTEKAGPSRARVNLYMSRKA